MFKMIKIKSREKNITARKKNKDMCYKRKSLPIQKCQKTRKHYRKECKWCVDYGKVAWSGHGRLCLCLAPHCVSCCDDCCWSLSWLPLSPAFHYRHTFFCAATVRHSLGRAVCRALEELPSAVHDQERSDCNATVLLLSRLSTRKVCRRKRCSYFCQFVVVALVLLYTFFYYIHQAFTAIIQFVTVMFFY